MSFVLKQGHVGQEVGRLQHALKMTNVDKEYGPKTLEAVKHFQKENGLTSDGVAGPKTLTALGINPLLGIDVSHWQGKIDWQKVKDCGVRFAYVKATQNTGYLDPTFSTNVAGARVAGIPVGVYHYAVATKSDAVQEAQFFLSKIEAVGPLDLPAILDLESNDGNLSPNELQSWSLKWIETVHAKTGKTPILYTYCPFLSSKLGKGEKLAAAGIKLWIARYHGVDKVEPTSQRLTIGKFSEWTIWQFDNRGNIDGIAGGVDRNWLPGGDAALKSLISSC